MISAARIPAEHLAALAPLRADDRIRIHQDFHGLWIRWPAELIEVLELLGPIPGVLFFENRSSRWHRAGQRLPSAIQPPSDDGVAIASLLAPAKFLPETAGTDSPGTLTLLLKRGGSPKIATALICDLAPLADWATLATTAELQALKAARCDGRAVVLGAKLPSIPATRYWGERLFVPLGYVPEPDLAEAILLAALGATTDEIVFLNEDHAEIIPQSAFHPLTRAGVRQVTA